MNMDVLPADLMGWLMETFAGEFTLTALVSMIPVVELRGGIPFLCGFPPPGDGGIYFFRKEKVAKTSLRGGCPPLRIPPEIFVLFS